MSLMTMIVKMSEGLGKTCAIFFLTLIFSLPLGMIVALLRMSKLKIVSAVTRFIITVLRGTPLMLQLLAVTYGPYYLFGAPVSRNKLIPVVIAFAINYAAYFAEIYRGGIESIPVGQYEAAEVLGYTKVQTFMRIILPQVIKRIMPSITNEVVTLVTASPTRWSRWSRIPPWPSRFPIRRCSPSASRSQTPRQASPLSWSPAYSIIYLM